MSSAVQDLSQRKNDPEHRNWMAVGDAILVLGAGIRKYTETKMLDLHALIAANVGAGVRCPCSCTPGKKPNPHGRTTVCKWAEELKKLHRFWRKWDIPWHQSDSNQWHDPVLGYWEIAKLFMSELGKNTATTKDPNTTDCASLLNLLINCNYFKIQNTALKAVQNWRNTWAHAPRQTLSETDKQAAFCAIDNLMNDPEFIRAAEVQACYQPIKDTEKADLASLQNDEVTIIQEYTRIQELENVGGKFEEIREKVEEINENVKEIKQEIRVSKEENVEVLPEMKISIKDYMSNILKPVSSVILAALLSRALPVQHKLSPVLWSLMAFFMFSQVGDRSLISDYGCPSAVMKSPISHYNFQEFDYSSYLAYKREGFVGRKWFFYEIETIFEESQVITGVLITGEPGSGKSALMSQLICSPYSSLLIHENIIGYHLCEYSEKGKRNGARFVRNLVDQIAARLPEYAKHVENNERVRLELDTRCHKDPTECFFSTIVGPLRKLKPPDNPQFIIIDALDECLESDTQTSDIIDILKNKIPHFPKWLKVILTSRNLTTVTDRLPPMQIRRTALYAADERNIKDIQYFVSRFISQNSHFSDRLLTAINIASGTQDMQIFLDELIIRSDGNFLFVKTTLQYMNDTGGKINLNSLPTSLFDLYNIFFDRQFGVGGFGPFKFLFEVLLAVYSPLNSQEVEDILISEYKATDFSKRIEHVSCFLRFSRDGTVRIYHQSFAEWLKCQATLLSINQTRGHQSIARFSLRRMRKRKENITFGELTELFMHILSGRSFEMEETAINLFNITEMRELRTNQSLLHYLVRKPSIYQPVLDFFLPKFQTVDVFDASNKTPAFYAASEGLVRSLQSCIDNGADINSFLEGYTKLDPVTAVVRNTGIEDFSLLHVAVAKGHKDVVELLLKSNITFPVSAKYYPTPLHLAAANGNLEIVKTFYDFGETFDQITLHHAAARNHLAVVRFVLSTVGIRDTCIQCQCGNFVQVGSKLTMHDIHAFFCETALHAAVSRGLVDMVHMLLDFGKEALECKHHSGKTVLIDAVERNDTEMVELLLRHGANATAVCGQKISRNINNEICSIFHKYMPESIYKVYCDNESCNCGYSAIHASAKYGLWKVAEIVFNHERIEVLVDLVDCAGDSAAHYATMYDHKDFLRNYNMSLTKRGQYLVQSIFCKLAVKYCSTNVAKLLLNYPSDEDENMWNFLRQSIIRSSFSNEIYSSYCLKAFADNNLSEAEEMQKESERRLNMLKLLIDAHEDKLTILYKEYDGRTLLHYAALYGFTDAVKYLVELGANTLLTDKEGNTPLMCALNISPINSLSGSYRCYTTNDSLFSSCTTTSYDETVSYLIQSQRASISKCDNKSAFLLKTVIIKRMPLSLYALLDIGVDWNCRLNNDLLPMFLHLYCGGWEVTEVVKMFEVDVLVKCGVSLSNSELHQLAYFTTPSEFGNFFKSSLNGKRSPLQRLIDRHPRGVRILDECYDADGELPLHYAIRGGNLDAIKWLKNNGANILLKAQSGIPAIDISIFCLGDNKCARINSNPVSDLVPKNANYRIECFNELLRAFFESSRKNYSTNFSSLWFDNFRGHAKPILLIASEGGANVVKIVYENALEIIPSLKINKYLLLDEQDANGDTPLHHAAHLGFEDVVKYLVKIGADIYIKNKNNNTPLLTALLSAPLNFIKSHIDHRCYTTNDNVFTSCETTPYDEIVRYLISLNKAKIPKCDDEYAYLLMVVILKRMPLSLYALLKNGVDINCQVKGELISNLLQHMGNGGQQVSEVLKIFGVNVSIQCGTHFFLSELHLIAYVPVTDNFGNFFTPSQDGKRSPLQRLIDRHPRGVRILSECYDADGYLPIHRAIEGGNLDALRWFKKIGANAHLKVRDKVSVLRLSIFCLGDNKCAGLHLNLFNNFVPANTKYRKKCFQEVLKTLDSNFSSSFINFGNLGLPILSYASKLGAKVVKIVYEKALLIIPSLKRKKYLLLNEQDANGNTPLHHAASHGLDKVVKYLVRVGADINIRNLLNNTPLFTALHYPLYLVKSHVDHRCYTTNDGVFTSCETTPYDEIVGYLISSQKSKVFRCDDENAYILNMLITKRMPMGLYALLKSGVDINCQKENEFWSNFLKHIRNGGQQVSEVLKIFEVNVSVQCGIRFTSSELHFLSYVPVTGDIGNFFNSSINGKRSPLKRLIDGHPRGVRLLDECYDAQGYLPIHRAADGGNLHAIRWFKRVGANVHLETKNGLTALHISILNLGNAGVIKYRRKVFKELLRTFSSTISGPELPCGQALDGLSLLHIAAVKGMAVLKYVHKKATEVFPSLPINCLNKHGLDPVFLADFYESVTNEELIEGKLYSKDSGVSLEEEIWKQVGEQRKRQSKNMESEFGNGILPLAQNPDLEIMYILVFNYLYRPRIVQQKITDIFSRHEDFHISDCPGYHDNSPKREENEFVPDLPDVSKCLKISNVFDKSSCLLEIANELDILKCYHLRKLLVSDLLFRRRIKRQLSSFMLQNLGWSKGFRKENIDYRWPFYFLHKMDAKKYKQYQYLMILNEPLEYVYY